MLCSCHRMYSCEIYWMPLRLLLCSHRPWVCLLSQTELNPKSAPCPPHAPVSFLKINDDIWKQTFFSFPTPRLTKQSHCKLPCSPLWCFGFLRGVYFSNSPFTLMLAVTTCDSLWFYFWKKKKKEKQYDLSTSGVNFRVLFLSGVTHLGYSIWTFS